jgi:hypothetical protein
MVTSTTDIKVIAVFSVVNDTFFDDNLYKDEKMILNSEYIV